MCVYLPCCKYTLLSVSSFNLLQVFIHRGESKSVRSGTPYREDMYSQYTGYAFEDTTFIPGPTYQAIGFVCKHENYVMCLIYTLYFRHSGTCTGF